MKILLACACGMSTSLIMSKMKQALSFEQKDWIVEACPFSEVEEYIDNFDVVLLGPQIIHKIKEMKKKFEHYNKPIELIEPNDYSFGNGKKVLEFAIKIYENKTKEEK